MPIQSPSLSTVPPSRLTTWIHQWVATRNSGGSEKPRLTIEPLAGDGSTRCFYRLKLQGERRPEETYIVLYDPEWILSKDYPAHQAYLSEHGIPVPRFLAADPAAGCLVMDDLGDELLQKRILGDPAHKGEWLTKAVILLARLHGATYPVPGHLPVASRHFDQKKYSDELRFTFEHLHEKLLGLPPPSTAQLSAIASFCEQIAGIRPEAFAHRDYHTRNILLYKEALYLIDFQDARLGAPHYDLASLLYDPYVPIPETEKQSLLRTYRQTLESFPLSRQLAEATFHTDLLRVALQRVIKAAGSYASFYTRYGKPTHLPYLRPALQSALSLVGELGGRDAALANVFPLTQWLDRAQELQTKLSS